MDAEVTIFDKIVSGQIPSINLIFDFCSTILSTYILIQINHLEFLFLTVKANIVYQDDLCLAFHDVNPQAPVHILLIPKQRNGLTQLSKAQEHNKEVLGHLLFTVTKIVELVDELKQGFRIVINDGENGGQSVWHLHLHIIGGEQLTWPPGSSGTQKK